MTSKKKRNDNVVPGMTNTSFFNEKFLLTRMEYSSQNWNKARADRTVLYPNIPAGP